MATGWVLIVAVLLLGGVIATVGDRLGTRVGKARLSLFNLRPRKTATLITIFTGGIISASTLAFLFAVSDQLRTGVFELENIQSDLETTRQDLEAATAEREKVESRLKTSREQQGVARRRLGEINQSLQASIERQAKTQAELNQTQNRLQQIQTRFQQAQTLLSSVSRQASSLRGEIEQLQADRQELIRQRDQVREQIAQRDAEIAARDQAIADRESQLGELEKQRSFLAQAVQSLEQEYQGLRLGYVTLFRNQPLASGIVRVVSPGAAPQAVDQLLREANRRALQEVYPGTGNADQQVIQITNAEVEQLVKQINDGRDYFIRILSGGNYVAGEPCVLAGEDCIKVFATVAQNQLVFTQGEVIATSSIDPKGMQDRDFVEQLNLLLAAIQFRARQAGIPVETIQLADNQPETISTFFQQVKNFQKSLDIQAIVTEGTYTSGPLHLQLAAVQNGQILFSTETLSNTPPSPSPILPSPSEN